MGGWQEKGTAFWQTKSHGNRHKTAQCQLDCMERVISTRRYDQGAAEKLLSGHCPRPQAKTMLRKRGKLASDISEFMEYHKDDFYKDEERMTEVQNFD